MNLKDKMLEDYPQLNETQIDKIIEEARVEEGRVRKVVREEVEKYFDERIPEFD